MTTNYEKIIKMSIKELAKYIRQEQLSAVFDGTVLSIPLIIEWLNIIDLPISQAKHQRERNNQYQNTKKNKPK